MKILIWVINGSITSLGMAVGLNPFVANAAGGTIGGISQAVMEGKNTKEAMASGVATGIAQGVVGGGFTTIGNSAFSGNLDTTAPTQIAKGIYNYVGEVFGMGAGISTEIVGNIYEVNKNN